MAQNGDRPPHTNEAADSQLESDNPQVLNSEMAKVSTAIEE